MNIVLDMRLHKLILKIILFCVIGLYFFLGMSLDKFIFFFVATCSLSFGLFLYVSPLKAFELQKKFYALINWRIEPISLTKEIRNTKIMGLFLILLALVATLYFFIRGDLSQIISNS